MLAKELMSHPVATCGVDDNLDRAANLMWDCDCGAVPIVDTAGCAVAMLTDRDICMAAYLQGKPLREISVRSAMSQSLFACAPDDSLENVEQLMMEHQIRRIPVIDPEGRPVGILSINDLARAANRQHPAAHGITNGLTLSVAAKTLAAVCSPRCLVPGPRLA